jgi:hypothetical protein
MNVKLPARAMFSLFYSNTSKGERIFDLMEGKAGHELTNQ